MGCTSDVALNFRTVAHFTPDYSVAETMFSLPYRFSMKARLLRKYSVCSSLGILSKNAESDVTRH